MEVVQSSERRAGQACHGFGDRALAHERLAHSPCAGGKPAAQDTESVQVNDAISEATSEPNSLTLTKDPTWPVRLVPVRMLLPRGKVMLRSCRRCFEPMSEEQVFRMSTEQQALMPQQGAPGAIDDFWSHSWQSPEFPKFLTLLLYYNGIPATLVSLVCAAASFPVLRVVHGNTHTMPVFTCALGVVGFFAVLLLWRPSAKVFFDLACVDYDRPKQRDGSIRNIGGTLLCPSTLLVLTDPTYTSRLWCVFEVAVFLRLRNAETQQVHFRSTFSGPLCATWAVCLLAIVFLMNSASIARDSWYFYMCRVPVVAASMMTRKFVHRNRELLLSTEGFDLHNADCFCCASEHRHPRTGEPISCDRRCIIAAICEWFGTESDFEHFVRTEVHESMTHQLPIPYRQLVLCSLVQCLSFAGKVVFHLMHGRFSWAAIEFEHLIRSMLVKGPLTLHIFLDVATVCDNMPHVGIKGHLATSFVAVIAVSFSHVIDRVIPRILFQLLGVYIQSLLSWPIMGALLYLLSTRMVPSVESWPCWKVVGTLVLLGGFMFLVTTVEMAVRAARPDWHIF